MNWYVSLLYDENICKPLEESIKSYHISIKKVHLCSNSQFYMFSGISTYNYFVVLVVTGQSKIKCPSKDLAKDNSPLPCINPHFDFISLHFIFHLLPPLFKINGYNILSKSLSYNWSNTKIKALQKNII